MSKFNLTKIKSLLIRKGIEFETQGESLLVYKSCRKNNILLLTNDGKIKIDDIIMTDREFEKWLND